MLGQLKWIGSVGKVDNGIVAVSSLWADEHVYYPLHVRPYTPASRLPLGNKDAAFRTKPLLALELIERAQAAGVLFRAVVADGAYGDNVNFEAGLWSAKLPYVVSLKPSKGSWAPASANGNLALPAGPPAGRGKNTDQFSTAADHSRRRQLAGSAPSRAVVAGSLDVPVALVAVMDGVAATV